MIDAAGTGVHPEVVAWTLAQLTEDERRELRDELKPLLKEVLRLDPADEDRFVEIGRAIATCLEAWRLSMVLHGDPDWQQQVQSARKAWEIGEGEVCSVAELRERLAV